MKTSSLSGQTGQKKIIILIAVVIVAALLVYLGMTLTKPALPVSANWYTVAPRDITEKVTFTAEVKPANNVDLGFARQGTVNATLVAVGDKVTSGQLLASLSHADISAQVAQARANLEAENAKLALLVKGARSEDIAVTEASLDASKTAFNSAGQSVNDKTRDAYTSADGALHNLLSGIFANPDTTDPRLTFQSSDSGTVASLQAERVQIGVKLGSWKAALDSSAVDPLARAQNAETLLREEISFLDSIAALLTGAIPDSANTPATLASYRTSTDLARANLNTSLSSVISAEQSYANTKAAVAVAERQLTLKQAPATPEDLAAEHARVDSASAALDSANAELAKTEIRAPFSGVVTRMDAKSGLIASPNVPLISLVSRGAYQIEGYLSEVDVAKVKVGASAQVTLDAFGEGDVLSAHVASVDPAPTLENGIPAYKTVISLEEGSDPGAKLGMHANVTVLAASKQGILAVPAGAIVSKLGTTYVEKQNDNGGVTLTKVTTGLSDDYVEIVSGLTAGDRIASFGIMNVTQ